MKMCLYEVKEHMEDLFLNWFIRLCYLTVSVMNSPSQQHVTRAVSMHCPPQL